MIKLVNMYSVKLTKLFNFNGGKKYTFLTSVTPVTPATPATLRLKTSLLRNDSNIQRLRKFSEKMWEGQIE